MRGNFPVAHVRCFRRGFEFLQRVLKGSGIVPPREHTPGGQDFDYIDAVLFLGANDVANLVLVVGERVGRLVSSPFLPVKTARGTSPGSIGPSLSTFPRMAEP
jgi:hypothetical protein